MHVGSSTRHLSELLIWREIYCKETKMCGHFNDITLKLWHNTKTNMTFSEKSQTQVQSILDRCIDFNDWNYFIPINFEFYLVSGQFSNWYSTYVFDSRYVFLPPSKHQIETFFCNQTVSRYHVDNHQWSKWSCLISILATELENIFRFE